MNRREHWDTTWSNRQIDGVSWYQVQPEPSLELIQSVAAVDARVVDVGGGASGLAGALLGASHTQQITVLDVSGAALTALAARLGDAADRVQRVVADVLEYAFEPGTIGLWHDRAVFHFFTEAQDRARYREQLESAVRVGGHAVIGTFALDGPTKCSGLPVQRYDAAGLMNELGAHWDLVKSLRHEHHTPSGAVQPFTFVVARHMAAEAVP